MSIDRSEKDKNSKNKNAVEKPKNTANAKPYKEQNDLIIYEDAKTTVSSQKKYDMHNLKLAVFEENRNENGAGMYEGTNNESSKKVKFRTQTEIFQNDLEVFKDPYKINGSSIEDMATNGEKDDVDNQDKKKDIVKKTNDTENMMTDNISDMTNKSVSRDNTYVRKECRKDVTWADIVQRTKQLISAQ